MANADREARLATWSRYRHRQRRIDGRGRQTTPLIDMGRDDVMELADRYRCDIRDLFASLAFLTSVAERTPSGACVGDVFTDAELEALHAAAERRYQRPKEH